MRISRKDFFKQGLFSLGKTALDIAGTLKRSLPILTIEPSGGNPVSEPRPDLVAEAFNDRCLARSRECSACIDSCKLLAIKLISGVGIRINPQFCNGCGACEYVCPVDPKSVLLIPRQQ